MSTTRASRRVIGAVLSVAMTLAGIALAPGAASAPTWLPLDPVHTAPNAGPWSGVFNADIAITDRGHAVMVWLDCISGITLCDTHRLSASMRKGRHGSDWTAPATIAEGGISMPQVDLDGNLAVLTWQQYDPVATKVRIRTATATLPAGSWSGPLYLSDTSSGSAWPTLDLDAQGRGILSWVQGIGPYSLMYRTRSATGTWGATQTASAVGHQVQHSAPIASINDSGAALLGWVADTDPDSGEVAMQVFARRRTSAGAPFGGVEEVSISVEQTMYPVGGVIAPDGDASMSWQRLETSVSELEHSSRPAGSSSWTAQDEIDDSSLSVIGYTYTNSPDGSEVWAWLTHNGSGYVPRGRKRSAAGAFAPVTNTPQQVTSSGVLPALATRNNKSFLAVIDTGASNTYQARVALGSMTQGSWGTVSNLTPVATSPPYMSPLTIGTDPRGNAIAAFKRDLELVVSPLDGAGPFMERLRVPKRARRGKRVEFSVRPYDVWSALAGRTKWTLGSKTKFGNRVTHRFTRAKRYRITATRTDARGNKTVVVRFIRIVRG